MIVGSLRLCTRSTLGEVQDVDQVVRWTRKVCPVVGPQRNLLQVNYPFQSNWLFPVNVLLCDRWQTRNRLFLHTGILRKLCWLISYWKRYNLSSVRKTVSRSVLLRLLRIYRLSLLPHKSGHEKISSVVIICKSVNHLSFINKTVENIRATNVLTVVIIRTAKCTDELLENR